MTDIKETKDYTVELIKLFDDFQSKALQLTTTGPEQKAKLEWTLSWMKHVMNQANGMTSGFTPAPTSAAQQTTGTPILYVDGGQNNLTGYDAWASVVDDQGNDMIAKYSNLLQDMQLKDVNLGVAGNRRVIVVKFNDVKKNQNNGAELLALVAGLRIATQLPSVKQIASDSQTIVDYWSKGHISEYSATKIDPNKKKYIEECANLRKGFENQSDRRVIKIDGDKNPADLGFHKGKK